VVMLFSAVHAASAQAQDASCPGGSPDYASAVDEQAVLLLQMTSAESMRGQVRTFRELANYIEPARSSAQRAPRRNSPSARSQARSSALRAPRRNPSSASPRSSAQPAPRRNPRRAPRRAPWRSALLGISPPRRAPRRGLEGNLDEVNKAVEQEQAKIDANHQAAQNLVAPLQDLVAQATMEANGVEDALQKEKALRKEMALKKDAEEKALREEMALKKDVEEEALRRVMALKKDAEEKALEKAWRKEMALLKDAEEKALRKEMALKEDANEKALKRDAAKHVLIPSREIAPGVHMPVISTGMGGEERGQRYEMVKSWLTLGGLGLDVGAAYGYEDDVSKAINELGVAREDIFLTSKLPSCQSIEADVIFQEVALLQVDYVDLLLLAGPTGNCTNAWQTLEDLYKQGLARSIGISNFGVADMQEILSMASIKPAVHQIIFDVFMHDDEVVSFTRAHNITIEAYSPLRDLTRSEVIHSIASFHDVSPYQVVLRWIVQQGHTAIFQPISREHQEVNADIFNFTLSDVDMALLDGLNDPELTKKRLQVKGHEVLGT